MLRRCYRTKHTARLYLFTLLQHRLLGGDCGFASNKCSGGHLQVPLLSDYGVLAGVQLLPYQTCTGLESLQKTHQQGCTRLPAGHCVTCDLE